MFDIGWSELVVIGVVALLVVGPKELPALLRTIGRYVGMIKRQANEVRAQFDEAIRETELEQLRREVASLKGEAESTLRSAEQSVPTESSDAKTALDNDTDAAKPDPAETKPDVKAAEARPQPAAVPAPKEPHHASGGVSSANGSGTNGFDGSAVEQQPRAAEADQSVKSGT